MAIKFKRGTSTQIASSTEVLETGQPLLDTTNGTLYVGDGSTAIKDMTKGLVVGEYANAGDEHPNKIVLQGTYTGFENNVTITSEGIINSLGTGQKVYWPNSASSLDRLVVSSQLTELEGQIADSAPRTYSFNAASTSFSWATEDSQSAELYGYNGDSSSISPRAGDILVLTITNPITAAVESSAVIITENTLTAAGYSGYGWYSGMGAVQVVMQAGGIAIKPSGARFSYEMILAYPKSTTATLYDGVMFKAAHPHWISGQITSVTNFAYQLYLWGYRTAGKSFPVAGYTFSEVGLAIQPAMAISNSFIDSVYVTYLSSSYTLNFCRNGKVVFSLATEGTTSDPGESVNIVSQIETSYSFGWKEDILGWKV